MFLGISPRLIERIKPISSIWESIYYKYDSDFPPKIKVDNENFGSALVEECFKEGGIRFGKTGKSNSKEGKCLSGDAGFDENDNVYAVGHIWKEEYFKNGLRDSVYKRFDENGKVIYETTFKMGTGLWKEFHKNGKVYFEINTKDGYFIDTLKLNDDKGKIIDKRLYLKDSLVYKTGLPCFPYRSDSLPSD